MCGVNLRPITFEGNRHTTGAFTIINPERYFVMTRQEYEKIYSRMTKLSIDSFIRDDSTILSAESDVFDEG